VKYHIYVRNLNRFRTHDKRRLSTADVNILCLTTGTPYVGHANVFIGCGRWTPKKIFLLLLLLLIPVYMFSFPRFTVREERFSCICCEKFLRHLAMECCLQLLIHSFRMLHCHLNRSAISYYNNQDFSQPRLSSSGYDIAFRQFTSCVWISSFVPNSEANSLILISLIL